MDLLIDLDANDLATVESADGIDLVLVSGEDEIVQNLYIRYRVFLSEQYYVEGYGMPYFTDVFNTPAIEAAISFSFSRIGANTPGVEEIVSVDFDLDALDSSQDLPITIEFKRVGNPNNITFPVIYDFTQNRTK